MDSLRKYIAEMIGTFVLVFFGCGTAVVTSCSTSNLGGYILTALAFGLVIVAMAYSVGNVSGCHINPAVSLAMFISKKLSLQDLLFYMCSQVIGATAGAFALVAFLGKDCGLGTNGLYDESVVKSLGIEVILTFVFVFVILGVTSKIENGTIAGVVIGLSLTLVHILGIAFTGTSVNPARSIGPAIFAGGDALENVWVFIVGPLFGGALAAIIYRVIDPAKKADAPAKVEAEPEKKEEAKVEA